MTGTTQLRWSADSSGIRFRLETPSGESLPPERWGLYDVVLASGQSGSVSTLLGLLEDEKVEADAQGGVQVPHAVLAALTEIQAAQLGLPAPAPVRLQVRGQGILTSPSFRFVHQLVKLDGTPVMGIKRNGVLVALGGTTYLLLNPLYALVEGMTAFNETPPTEMDARMLRWADMKPWLPDDALVDKNLRAMNIVRADNFTLDLDDNGDFSPQLLKKSKVRQVAAEGEDQPGADPALPAAPQREFARRFTLQSTARRHYTTESGWFVVVPDHLQKALAVVREKQDAPYAEKRAFIANPTAVLKERLQDVLTEYEVEGLFEETPAFLSQRITHLGQWEPKQNVYKLPSGQRWLPDDEDGFGVEIGKSLFSIAAGDIPGIIDALAAAERAGEPFIDYRNQQIPVTDEAIETLGRLSERQKSFTDKEAPADGPPESDKKPGKPLVPVLADNVEDVGFAAENRPIRGEPGGLPQTLKTTTLYAHQKAGLQWLQEHWASGSTGALLADDMGLGKTLQTLAFLAWVQEQMTAGHHPRRPVLVVAPTGLLKNWEDEATMHLHPPGLGEMFKAFGPALGAFKPLSHIQRKQRLESAGWVLTTYETLRDKIRYFLPVRWGVVAFDEVQKIKNPASRLTEMAKAVDADFFLALTGTPVENRLGDLWSIIDAVAPGSLGSLRDFHKRYEDVDEATRQITVPELKAALTVAPEPVRLLRRMKADHLEGLPEKTEHVLEILMPPEQAKAYDAAIAPARAGGVGRMEILGILQAMRKVSLMPGRLGTEGMSDDLIQSSARLSALIKILDQIKENNEKALVFVEFLAIQDALLPYLQRRYQLAKPPLRISGTVAGAVRKKHVDEFQSRPRDEFDVMLLSPKAGGVGLTLTAANNVIHLSRWWNPAVEDQCTDRVFRIGQKRAVNVYLPLAIHPHLRESSFDTNLHQLLQRKRALSSQLLGAPAAAQHELDQLLNASI